MPRCRGGSPRLGDPAQTSSQVADNLEVHTGRVMLAGIQLRMILPASTADQGAIDDQLLIAGQVFGGWVNGRITRASSGVIAVIAREIVD